MRDLDKLDQRVPASVLRVLRRVAVGVLVTGVDAGSGDPERGEQPEHDHQHITIRAINAPVECIMSFTAGSSASALLRE